MEIKFIVPEVVVKVASWISLQAITFVGMTIVLAWWIFAISLPFMVLTKLFGA